MRVCPLFLPVEMRFRAAISLLIISVFFALPRIEAQSTATPLVKVPTSGDASRYSSYDVGKAQGSQSMEECSGC